MKVHVATADSMFSKYYRDGDAPVRTVPEYPPVHGTGTQLRIRKPRYRGSARLSSGSKEARSTRRIVAMRLTHDHGHDHGHHHDSRCVVNGEV